MHILFTALAMMMSRTGRDDDDRTRLSRISQGDENALSEMYDRYAPFLYSFVLRILRSVDDAEEIVQEVFLHVWSKAATYDDGKGTVYTWLVSMTRNRAIDRLRSKDFKARFHEIDISGISLAADARGGNPHSRTVLSEEQQIVAGSLSQLSLDHQLVLSLAYYEGFSQSEIARKLDIPPGTVKSRMRKALESLRSLVREKL